MRSATAERPTHLRLVPTPDPPPQGRHSDRAVPLVLFSTVALLMIGLIMVLSASSVSAYEKYGSSFLFFQRQAAHAAVGAGAMWLTARMRYEAWARLCLPLLLLSGLLLALVLHPSVGTVAGGSARWIEVGPVTVQPSELAKLAVLAFAAALLARRWKRLGDLRSLVLPLAPVVGVVTVLILLQPDMGTAVIILSSVLVLAFVAGARIRHLAAGTALLGVAGFGLMYVAGYRWARFLSFLDPWEDRLGQGWHTVQSLIALGSGGPLGVGLGASRQKWSYVPNAHTDFIFSIIGEELGVVGAVAVLILFGLLVFAGIRIAVGAPDAFGRLLAGGITGWLGIQALVNLGAVTGLLPITGVPLPLVSFGGSSLVVSMAAIGILISIGRRTSRIPVRA